MSDVRVALVGCGGMGKSLVGQLVTVPGAVIAAGVDPQESARQAFAELYGVPTYESLDQLLGAADVDAVIVATPNSTHASNVITAARAGKHVFCEKPMALTVADCQAMIDACAQAGVKLQIGQVLRYLPDFTKAIAMVRKGDLGQLVHGAISRYSAPRENWNQTWRDDRSLVGHHLFEVSVHELDFARCVFGKPVAVSGWDVNLNPDSPLWSQAITGVIEFEGGAICVITEGMFNPFGRTEVELCGTEGAVRFHWGKDFAYKSLTGRPDFELTGSQVAEGVENGVRREVREWIEAIVNDTPPTIPGEEGKANIELAAAILASSERRERITLPLE